MAEGTVAEEIDVATAHAMWRAGDPIVDVRPPEEYALGHIAGALNVPLRELAARESEVPAGQVIAVCSIGHRSLRGAHTLARLGRTSFSLRGGTKAWKAAGYPIVADAEPGARGRVPSWRQLLARLRAVGP